ncbi:MAG TPA: ABC transporter substrate-binding protein [Anaerolineales bacterium]|nr:ABC transporter substrate-binding protein [Anaerolineales bacterium]
MLRKTLILTVLIALLTACAPATAVPTEAPLETATQSEVPTEAPAAPEHNLTDGCVPEGQFDPNVDYFPEKATLTYTENFSIEYHNNYKVVTIAMPYPGASEPLQYALVQCGTPAPEGFAEQQIIEVPVQTIVTMSTTYLPFLDELGLLDRLVGLDDATYVSNPTVLKMAEEGKLTMIGYGSSVNVEKALELAPDLIMTYGSGAPEYDAHPVLLDAGLKVVLNAEWMDTSPLGRAEWGKFIAAFFNKEADAEALFAEKAQKYEELKALVANVAEKPTVFTATAYQGTWNVPGGNSFAAAFLKDAGATYLWADDTSTGSLPLSFEAVFEKAKDADYWLNVGFVGSLEDLKSLDARYADFAAFQNGNVWNNDAKTSPNGGNDYYESAVAHPEIVLADLIKIFHPDLLPDHELVYYRQLK